MGYWDNFGKIIELNGSQRFFLKLANKAAQMKTRRLEINKQNVSISAGTKSSSGCIIITMVYRWYIFI